MESDEKAFVALLQRKAKTQAQLVETSPIPEWMRPFVAIIGMRYWMALLCFSGVIAMFVSVWFFPMVYTQITGLP